jgi:hypothetical protein
METTGRVLLGLTLVLTAPRALLGQAAQTRADTVDVPVGSPLVDTRHLLQYASHGEERRIGPGTSVLDESNTDETTYRDSAGIQLMVVSAHIHHPSSATPAATEERTVVMNRHTLAVYSIEDHDGNNGTSLTVDGATIHGQVSQDGKTRAINIKLPTPGFIGNFSDILAESLPRRAGVVYRAPMWNGPSSETHLFETHGREDVDVLGKHYQQAWVVEDHKADGTLAGRLWLLERPPYLVRWILFDVPTAGTNLYVDEELINMPQ